MSTNFIVSSLSKSDWVVEPIIQQLICSLNQYTTLSFGVEKSKKLPIWLKSSLYYKVITPQDVIDRNFSIMPIDYSSLLLPLVDGNIKSIKLSNEALTRLSQVNSDLKELYPNVYELLTKYVNSYLLCSSPHFGASSHPHAWGMVFITETLLKQSNTKILESRIHELAHQELFLINLVDKLVEEDSKENMVYAPFQKINRPPIGRLHSCHALYRMSFIEESSIERSNEIVQLFGENIDTFHDGELTKFGKRLISEVYIPRFNDLIK